MMYRSCLFCHSRFATNAEFPELPIGRRIAYDPHRGRLWVICQRCGGWNLTPFEWRIETIERCERIWREASRIDTTPGITLTRTPTGVDLIRVGHDDRAEFASWRWATRFKHRQWIQGIRLGLGLGILGFAIGGLLKLGLVVGGYLILVFGTHLHRFWNRTLVRVPTAAGPYRLTRRDLRRAVLSAKGVVRVPGGGPSWAGPGAVIPLMLILPYYNRHGASRRHRAQAITILEALDDPVTLLRQVPSHWAGPIVDMPYDARLALEMAANEQAERDAIEGRLEALRDAWKEAEETAAIADSLLIPDWVSALIRRWKSHPPRLSDRDEDNRTRPGVVKRR